MFQRLSDPSWAVSLTGDAAEWAVGIVVGGSEALVCLCDGKNPGQWFGATIKAGALKRS